MNSVLPTVPPTIPVRADLRLRPWRDSDSDAIYRACNEAEIQRWTTVPSPYTPEDAVFFLGLTRDAWASGAGGSLALVDPARDEPIGSFGFVGYSPEESAAEIGYWIAAPARGRGYATATLDALSEYALGLVGLERVYLRIDPENSASRALARAAGYTLTERGITDARTRTPMDTFTRHAPRG
ncbi:GNAT family N-acetyltransferase [Mycetocola spongiae]|uniref:GNAT family N-acetyltransferase n=1 Tax=Mycetocola spongiae TaxID=2859226 RepID=UPI001CF2DB0E|nr:GNAT family N-acetyltransferase [Mycetocola spongiae]UCR89306.1 GNAT family N-acetyltransferase [Mycetocola spongiae]